MASLNYLTIQDILWINLQVTKKVHHFNYARLEEATFYQYAYGESNSLLPQAARFLSGFVKMHPFEAGNEGTAFVSCLAFLHINGATTAASDNQIAEWFERASRNEKEGRDLLEQIVAPDEAGAHAIVPDVRSAVKSVLDRYGSVLAALNAQTVRQTA